MRDKKVLGKSLVELVKENRYEKIRGLQFREPLLLIHQELLDTKKKKEVHGKI